MHEDIGQVAGAIWRALHTPRPTFAPPAQEGSKRQEPSLRLGDRLARPRGQDCHQAEEPLVHCAAEISFTILLTRYQNP